MAAHPSSRGADVRQPRRPHRRHAFLPALALSAAGLVVLGACGSDSGTTASSPTTASTTTAAGVRGLEGIVWEADPASLGVTAASAPVPTLLLQGGTASGFSGCNTYRASYVVNGTSLVVTPGAATSMACVGPAGDVEAAFMSALSKTASFDVGVSGLQLRDASGAKLVQLNVANSSLVGQWTITGYLNADKSGFVSTVAGAPATATFADNGPVSGNAGCNNYTGPWKQSDDRVTISIGPLASTARACIEADISAQDAAVPKALEASVTAEVTTHSATFLNAANQRTVTLTR
jgi:heat shock protein HslJ